MLGFSRERSIEAMAMAAYEALPGNTNALGTWDSPLVQGTTDGAPSVADLYRATVRASIQVHTAVKPEALSQQWTVNMARGLTDAAYHGRKRRNHGSTKMKDAEDRMP
jgi:hypothetical protein